MKFEEKGRDKQRLRYRARDIGNHNSQNGRWVTVGLGQHKLTVVLDSGLATVV